MVIKEFEKKEYRLKFKDIIIDIIDIMGYSKDDGEVKEIKKYLENIDNNYLLLNKDLKIRKKGKLELELNAIGIYP